MEGSGESSYSEIEAHQQELADWFKKQAIALDISTPQEGQNDLAPLKGIVGTSNVVGLGEATHGNKEFFQMKHRLVKYLVEEMDFDTIAMECPEDRAEIVNEYVMGADLNQQDILNGLTYETWRTQEVVDMVEWLRKHNAKSEKKVKFVGCDTIEESGGANRDLKMAENVKKIVDSAPKSKVAVWAHNAHVGYDGSEGVKSMGSNLKDMMGDKYMSFGMIFNQGSLSVRVGSLETGQFKDPPSVAVLKPAPNDTYEHSLSSLGIERAFVDLRGARQNGTSGTWGKNKYGVREFGWAYDPKHENYFIKKKNLADAFDGVVFINNVTPSTPLT